MRIKTITARWGHADFNAIFICENCSAEHEIKYCYDDDFYHRNVVPGFTCPSCGESRDSIESIRYTCPHCCAEPGTTCTTPKGAKSLKPHRKRIDVVALSNRKVRHG